MHVCCTSGHCTHMEKVVSDTDASESMSKNVQKILAICFA